MNDKQFVPLTTQADGTLTGAFKAMSTAPIAWSWAPNGEYVVASPEYTIDVIADGDPTVSFKRPGRDTSVSPIEEVFVEAARRGRLRDPRPRARVLGERRRGEES